MAENDFDTTHGRGYVDNDGLLNRFVEKFGRMRSSDLQDREFLGIVQASMCGKTRLTLEASNSCMSLTHCR